VEYEKVDEGVNDDEYEVVEDDVEDTNENSSIKVHLQLRMMMMTSACNLLRQ